jgi:hypothetical protein
MIAASGLSLCIKVFVKSSVGAIFAAQHSALRGPSDGKSADFQKEYLLTSLKRSLGYIPVDGFRISDINIWLLDAIFFHFGDAFFGSIILCTSFTRASFHFQHTAKKSRFRMHGRGPQANRSCVRKKKKKMRCNNWQQENFC